MRKEVKFLLVPLLDGQLALTRAAIWEDGKVVTRTVAKGFDHANIKTTAKFYEMAGIRKMERRGCKG